MLDFNDDKKVQELLRKINQDIQRELSEKRYNHSIGAVSYTHLDVYKRQLLLYPLN